MKDTGVIRKLDDLGRIVIPKEIRKNMRAEPGTPFEFYIERGKIILKKYQPKRCVLTGATTNLVLFNGDYYNREALKQAVDKL